MNRLALTRLRDTLHLSALPTNRFANAVQVSSSGEVSDDSSFDETAAARRPDVAIIVSCKSVPGGAQQVALNIAEEFTKRGLTVDFVMVSYGEGLAGVPGSVRVVRLRGRARMLVPTLRRYLKTAKPKVVISLAFHINILTALASIGLQERPRLILSVHNSLSQTLRAIGWPASLWTKFATMFLYRLADGLVAVSEGAADDLARVAKLNRKSIRTIYNPVIRSDYHTLVSEIPSHPWASGKTCPLVVSIGRLSEQKNHAVLIRAFAKVISTRDARLLILGEGNLRKNLENLILGLGLEGSVALPGYVDNPLPYMKAADVFVLSSDWEGFGNVLAEAMAAGTPVISTDCPHGPREILADGKWGKLVPVGDPDALAEAMLEILRSGGADARPRARQFSVEAAAEKYLKAVQDVQAEPARS